MTSPASTLVNYTAEISKLRTKAPWKKVLENEETAKNIQDIIRRMDSSLATFQVWILLFCRLPIYHPSDSSYTEHRKRHVRSKERPRGASVTYPSKETKVNSILGAQDSQLAPRR
jgi:hypothetical protein